MSEKDNLQEADGIKEKNTPQGDNVKVNTAKEDSTEELSTNSNTTEDVNLDAETTEASSLENSTNQETEGDTESTKKDNDVLEEIEASNAEDAEDESNSKRHDIKEKDYHSMSLGTLVDELEHLVKNEKIQTIKTHFDTIKNEFNAKFSALLEEKKEEFLAGGGNSIDFHFNSPEKTRLMKFLKSIVINVRTIIKI